MEYAKTGPRRMGRRKQSPKGESGHRVGSPETGDHRRTRQSERGKTKKAEGTPRKSNRARADTNGANGNDWHCSDI